MTKTTAGDLERHASPQHQRGLGVAQVVEAHCTGQPRGLDGLLEVTDHVALHLRRAIVGAEYEAVAGQSGAARRSCFCSTLWTRRDFACIASFWSQTNWVCGEVQGRAF